MSSQIFLGLLTFIIASSIYYKTMNLRKHCGNYNAPLNDAETFNEPARTHISLKLYLHDKDPEFVYLTGAVILSTRQNKYVFRVWAGRGHNHLYLEAL